MMRRRGRTVRFVLAGQLVTLVYWRMTPVCTWKYHLHIAPIVDVNGSVQ